MLFSPSIVPSLIQEIASSIINNAEEVTALDQAIGDGDHVTNLQRGIHALIENCQEISQLDWSEVFQKTGMLIMTNVGGASGSLYGTLFIKMSKVMTSDPENQPDFADVFAQGVDAVKRRGKADAGEKTMLDVLIPVSTSLQQATDEGIALSDVLEQIKQVSIEGMESTRNMLATKGRASYLGERTLGHIDAGARTSQLMICSIADVLAKQLASPS